MSVLHTRLQYTTHLRHKVICVTLGAGQAKATLARKGNPPHILPATRAQEFSVPSLFLAAPQHLLHHLLAVLASIPRMALFELVPMILEYLTKGVPINSCSPCCRSTSLSTMTTLISFRKNANSYTIKI
jgi:hypothetical protein